MEPFEEYFDLLDGQGLPLGRTELRRRCHGDPSLIHPAVHIFVFNHAGSLFLQQRSPRKDTQPGRWDTSVGGHPHPGEPHAKAALREMAEELGWAAPPPSLLFSHAYLWRSARETEFVHAFVAVNDGPFALQAEEIADGRFWMPGEIEAALGRDVFTPNFEHEWRILPSDPSGALRACGVRLRTDGEEYGEDGMMTGNPFHDGPP